MTDSLIAFLTGSAVSVMGFGFLLGLKHATDADHLAAISTIVTDRKSLWSSALVGGLWGVGHTFSLLLAGIFVLLLNFEISQTTERALEFCVGIMLVFLGLNVLRKLFSGGHLHFHSHEHGKHMHAHPHIHAFDERDAPHTHHGLSLSPRALFIGMVHGLAGSAALMLLVIPTIDSRPVGLLYISVFGVGSIGGMMLMSFFVGLPFHLTALRFHRFNQLLQGMSGAVSLILGLWTLYEKGISESFLL